MTDFSTWDYAEDTWDNATDTWAAGAAPAPTQNPSPLAAGSSSSSVSGTTTNSGVPVQYVPYLANVVFYGGPQPFTSPNVQIIMQEYAHDTIVLNTWNDDVMNTSYKTGQPMSVSYGRPLSGMRTIYGYVNHAGRTTNALQDPGGLLGRASTTVVCVGASWPMNQRGTLSWTSTTADQIVKQIAALFGLALDTVPDSTVWPSIQMNGMKYWDFCVMLAKRIGYTFYCSGITLVFKPRQTNPNNLAGLVAYYDFYKNIWACPVFSPVIGSNSPMGGELVNRQLGGINMRTNQPYLAQTNGIPSTTSVLGQAPNTPIFTRTHHESSGSLQEAQAKTNGATLTNQLYITATGLAQGDPFVAQGSLVYVANANGSQNGLWYITKCNQTLDNQNYLMDITLGRDSLGSTVSISGVTPTTSGPLAALGPSGLWSAVAP